MPVMALAWANYHSSKIISGHGLEISMGQEPFPVSNLDIAMLPVTLRDFKSKDVGFTMPVGLGTTERSRAHVKDEYS